ncbi:MAG: hypothetical protein E6H84_13340 [Chloroflexi bacterium]|nr:MAG: hypothetical protein E6H84_13340 [Chloroflexota bacterium]TMG65383.1 MAG: hypothetical protein E6H81_14985 [Chloroflexota bacterium]
MSEGERASNIVPFGPRPPGTASARRPANDPLTDRVAALETQLVSLEANITRERALLSQLSESEAAVEAAWGKSDSGRGHDAERNSRALLERAMGARRELAEQVAVLRTERDALLDEISALRRGSAAPAHASAEQAKDEKLEDVVGALREAVHGLVEEIQVPADVIEASSPALHEDVDELPLIEAQKGRELGLIEDEDILATADEATVEDAQPAVSMPATTPDASIVAMWEAVPAPTSPSAPPEAAQPQAPTEVLTVPPMPIATIATAPIVVERASFITDEFILETSPLLRARVVEAPAIIEAAPEIEPPAARVEVAEPIEAEPIQAEPVAEQPVVRAPLIEEPITHSEPAPAPQLASNRIQLVISPIASFSRLLEIQGRLAAIASIRELQLRDYRNGVAIFALTVGESISAHEFGAVVQMLGFGLRLLGATQMNVELRLDDAPAVASPV